MAEGARTAITTLAASSDRVGGAIRAAAGLLVLDAAGARLLDASGRAVRLAPLLADADGRLRDGGLAAQLRALSERLPPAGQLRLERLRLGDRLAPPVTCTCLRAEHPDLGPVLVLALPGGPRPQVEATTEPEPPIEPAAAEVSEASRPSLRFLWRSDAEGRLFEASAVLADRVRGGVVGRTWPELLRGSVADEAGRLAEALAARVTFRGVPARWRIGGGPRSLAVELSATPRRAPDAAFAGFDGFGLIEAGAPAEPVPVEPDEPSLAVTTEPPAAAAAAVTGPSSPPAAADLPAFASFAGAAMAGLTEIMAAPFGFGWHVSAPVRAAPAESRPEDAASSAPTSSGAPTPDPAPLAAATATALPEAPDASEPEAPAAPEPVDEPAGDDSQLSLSEHHAFREIARALGARFAGDEPADAVSAALPDAQPASVTTLHPLARPARAEAGGVPAGGVSDETPAAGEADTRRLLDNLPIGTLVHRGETALYANRAFLETVGYADVPELQEDGGVARLFRGGPSGGRRSTDAAAVGVSTKTGATVPVEVRVTTVPWGRDPAGLMLVRRLPDVDPVQRAAALELELAAARARLKELAAILDASGDAVVTADARLRLTSLNARAESLFGYDAREVAGEPMALLVAAESHPALHGLVEAVRAGGPAAGALTGRGRGGAALPLDARLARLPAESGEVPAAAFCAVLVDASASRAATAKVAAAEGAARDAGDRAVAFLERAGHEIRTPLNTVLGFAELMLEERFGPVGNERYRGYLRDLHAAGARVVGLVGDLLDLARLEAGRQPLSPEPVELGAVAAACVNLFQAQASRARIIVRTSFAPGVPRVRADAAAMRRIAENLVANAIRFTPAGGQVIVSTGTAERGAVFLRVRDTGIGMTRDEVAAAFDAFRSPAPSVAEGAGDGATSGTGLGLPLTRALATANGAALHVQSTKGEGTLVELLVPPDLVVRD